MKQEHKEALLNDNTLKSPSGYLMWFGDHGYFNCLEGSDCPFGCEDFPLKWDDVESYYKQWEDDEWEID